MPDLLGSEALPRLAGVLAVNLLLSGDNAVVIALAVRRLKGATRRRAVLLGAGGAVALRIVFAVAVTFLLEIPLLQAAGGLLLFWIAWQLVQGDQEEAKEHVSAGGGLWQAVRIIIVADVVMSLDNVVALVGVSGGHLFILGIGLLLTIPLVVWGATLLSSLLDRFPWLAYAGAGLLAYVAAEMILGDEIVRRYAGALSQGLEAPVSIASAVVFVGIILGWKRVRGG
ncbi:TerC family protein [Rubrobacter calidifluminis]|uniref:TerC family protein n=1 Tax=Rubrobacter calidifluminis TaxID=1392640 RepID=UPI00235F18A0|nr:TerC family protein [Rubrobacter calidifluminis]